MTRSRDEFTVQVLRTGSGVPVGVGFVVDETHIVTCAHVVNTALGRGKHEQDPPDPGARIQVALPLLDGDDDALTLSCVVQKWMPPPISGVSGGDVAGLAIDGDELPGLARAAWLADYREFRDAEAKVFGYPEDPPRKENGGWATVRVRGRVGRRMIELDVASESAFFVQPGYSGSPVVVTDGDGHDSVIAMLSAADADGAKDALAIPAAALAQAWPEVVARLPIEKCPYRGLDAFTADDVDVFAGRKDDVDRLRKMVRGRALTMVNGPSGVGKSSLVNAGLIPQLEAGGWATGTFRPGKDPVSALARTLASMEVPNRTPTLPEINVWKTRIRSIGLGDAGAQLALALNRPVILHVDQFEEVLDPQACAPDVRAEFLELLLSARSPADEGLHLVGTVRADFMAQILEHPDAGARLAGGWFGLSPMSTERLMEVITEPAGARGVRYEDGLAARIASEAGDGPVLPLLEFALTQLWEHKRGPEIGHAAYQSIGGVAGALSQYAEGVYRDDLLARFPEERIRRVLLALVRSRGGASDATRRVVSRSWLGADWDIAQELATYRMVAIGGDDIGTETAEIAHEALIREWPRLKKWVETDSNFQRWLSMAEERAVDGELLPDSRIEDADKWLKERAEDIPSEVQKLIQDSKSERRRRIGELEDALNRAEARRLAAAAEFALAERGTSLQVPIILAVEALKTALVVEADIAVRHAIRTAACPLIRLDHSAPVRAFAFSPDGTRIATANGGGFDDRSACLTDDGSARLIDAASGDEIWRLDYDRQVNAVVFSPDGTRVATATRSYQRNVGDVRVLDAASGDQIWRLDHPGHMNAVVFSPDGTRIATANSLPIRDEDRPGLGDVRVLDAASGDEIWRLDYDRPVNAVVFSPDGTQVASASGYDGAYDPPTRDICDGSTRLIDAASGDEIWRLDYDMPVEAVVFSPDGAWIATTMHNSFEGRARVVNVTTGAGIRHLNLHWDYGNEVIKVNAVVFSSDGTRIAIASGDSFDGSVRMVDASTGEEIWRLDQDTEASEVAFSSDGTLVAIVSKASRSGGDSSVRVVNAATGDEIWRLDHPEVVDAAFSPTDARVAITNWVIDTATGAEIWRLDHDGEVKAVAFSPDGTRVAIADGDDRLRSHGSARVVDAATGDQIWHLRYDRPVNAIAISPDGTRIATASGDLSHINASARLLDAETGAEIWRLDHHWRVNTVTFSPDSTRIVIASESNDGRSGSARVIDAVDGVELWCLSLDKSVNAVTFNPDSTRVAIASGRYPSHASIRSVNAANGDEIWHLEDRDLPVNAMAYSPDGTQIAIASGFNTTEGSARLIDAKTGAEIWRLDYKSEVTEVAFSPDGDRVAIAIKTGRTRAIDVVSGAEIWRLDHESPVNAIVFSPDGTRVATASGDIDRHIGSARVIDAATGTEISRLDHDGRVNAVAFSPDGTRAATASHDGSARVWYVDRSMLIEQALGRMTRNLTRQEWNRYFPDQPYRKTRHDLP